MRRWLPISLLGIIVAAAVLFSFIPQQRAEEQKLPAAVSKVTIYTDMPTGVLQAIAETYRFQKQVQLEVITLPEEQLIAKLQSGGPDVPDMVWGSELLLRTLQRNKILVPYTSEHTDMVAPQMKNEDGYWTGTWYLPMVFAVQDEYYRKIDGNLYTWDDLLHIHDAGIAMTDFVAADLAAELLYSMVTVHGEKKAFAYLRELHRSVQQYAKYLSTPVRLLSTQRCDIAIADAGTVRLFIAEGYHIRMIYPRDGTAYYLYGAGIVKGAKHPQEAAHLLDWFLAGNAFATLQKQGHYLYYTGVPNESVTDAHGDQPILWNLDKNYTREGERELIAKWLDKVRFAEEGDNEKGSGH